MRARLGHDAGVSVQPTEILDVLRTLRSVRAADLRFEA
jgi:hypothetical protein